jgi:hypothetical protein
MNIPKFATAPSHDFAKLSQQDLAARAQNAWHRAGHRQVRVWAEEKSVDVSAISYVYKGEWVHKPARRVLSLEICSNLVGGLPPKAAA